MSASIYNVFDGNYAASGPEEHLQNDMEQDGRFAVPGAEYLAGSYRQLGLLGREGEVNNTFQRLIETGTDYENLTGVQEANRLRKVG